MASTLHTLESLSQNPEDAISAIYPEAEYQGCVVHVIRNSLKYVSHDDMQEFSRDAKSITIYECRNL